MRPLVPNLWFNYCAEEAAAFYTGLFPDSRIDRVMHAPADNPSTREGEVVAVEFTLLGQSYIGINGGPKFPFSEAVSFAVECEDQAEVDRYWEALTADGGRPGPCGWCKDRYGLSWQVVPKRLLGLLYGEDRDAARRAAETFFKMQKIDLAAVEAAAA